MYIPASSSRKNRVTTRDDTVVAQDKWHPSNNPQHGTSPRDATEDDDLDSATTNMLHLGAKDGDHAQKAAFGEAISRNAHTTADYKHNKFKSKPRRKSSRVYLPIEKESN